VKENIDKIRDECKADLEAVQNTTGLENLKVKYLGKKGPVQDLMKSLKDISADMRPAFGKIINELKEDLHREIEEVESRLSLQEVTSRIEQEKIDVTLPGRKRYSGRTHVLAQALDEIIDILIGMGFSVQYGPDIETEYYNFEALNFAPDHPARDMQDTFYITPNVLLRTHATTIQARALETYQPPIRIIAPGKVYRNETITARSHVFFHQVDAVYVDEGVTFSELFGTMKDFLTKLFHEDVQMRFRPSFFPFVEPGMEVDVSCLSCRGSGCQLCKYSGWLEVGGAGMVHPEVLRNGGIDPERYTGYAWGMGVERLVMLKHGITDIRMFTENDTRFLSQFSAG
jgi:phenylalanyl-tRNA synthetase alpha chain